MEAVYEIPNGNVLEGSLPSNKERLVQAWIEIHKEDLMANTEWILKLVHSVFTKASPQKALHEFQPIHPDSYREPKMKFSLV